MLVECEDKIFDSDVTEGRKNDVNDSTLIYKLFFAESKMKVDLSDNP